MITLQRNIWAQKAEDSWSWEDIKWLKWKYKKDYWVKAKSEWYSWTGMS
jgi:hypothetical protein